MVRVDHLRDGIIPAGSPVFVDEAQLLTRRNRRALFRPHRSFVIGTHTDLTRELERTGFRVSTVHPAADLTLDRLRQIVARRIEWARRRTGIVPTVDDETLQELLVRFAPDLRAIESALYETFQEMKDLPHVEV